MTRLRSFGALSASSPPRLRRTAAVQRAGGHHKKGGGAPFGFGAARRGHLIRELLLAMADAGDDDDDKDEEAVLPPKYAFDGNTMDCVLDLRALCGLPEDPEEDGVVSFRALLLPKGKTLHVPDETGCYATLGPWRMQTALSLVHFVTATARKPELLLAFVDYGMLSNGASTGVFVMSLQLPLSKKRNVFEETPRFSKVADVAGFTTIDAKQQPWCAQLEPALKRQPLYEGNNLYSPADIPIHLRSPLATRIVGLLATARAGIATKVSALGRQDKRQAERVKAQLTAQLDRAHQWLLSLPPSKYDKRTEGRIILVKPGVDNDVAWLTSPQRTQLQSGSAECKPTARAIRRILAPAPDAAPAVTEAPDVGDAPAPADRGIAVEDGSDLEDSSEFEQLPEEAAAVSKRARKATAHFEPDEPEKAGAKKKGVSKAATKVGRQPTAHVPTIASPSPRPPMADTHCTLTAPCVPREVT